ncbi:MAG TPA: tRNA (adenosine(37)-N6)-threonylcarbamoyltransferase complex transferase subunit TsaD [Cyclobacteriaceae bacterium]|nr:tRNA (adenosine(37)-N6)-threonylcarbamoyltransferase complex transferase subunit TsaD [Cyclobacteriaceae bacterium]
MRPTILAIESSCDETSASVLRNGKVLNNIIASQNDHAVYGGVVPELASRAHQRKIVEVVQQALSSAGLKKEDIDAVAFTRGPGLMGALLVGSSFAKGLSWSLGIPLIEVNHMHAHILAHFIPSGHAGTAMDSVPSFPFICLTVSGGHTQLVWVRGLTDMEIMGQTQDDAAGEAFDKSAKILGLPYPGGPLIDHHAKNGNPRAFRFPDTDMPGLDFSFSGLKTAFLYFIRDQKIIDPEFVEKNLADICASIQSKIVGMLMDRLVKASAQTGIKNIAIAGGVSANSGLRNALETTGRQLGWNTFIPEFQYCTDNAAMIGMVAHYKYQKGEFAALDIAPIPNLDFAQ